MTRPAPARPAVWAYSQEASAEAASRATLWPLPEEDITGFTTQGKPTASHAARN